MFLFTNFIKKVFLAYSLIYQMFKLHSASPKQKPQNMLTYPINLFSFG